VPGSLAGECRRRLPVPAADQIRLDQGPGAVADDGCRLAGPEGCLDELEGLGHRAELIGIGDSARQDQGVAAGRVSVGNCRVHRERITLSRWLKACAVPGLGDSSSGIPPASVTACQGAVNSPCSIPSLLARNAIRWPASWRAMGLVLSLTNVIPSGLASG
jgi:hypothetical protein